MLSLWNILFGPLDKFYCIYFYILSVIGILFGIFLCILCIAYPIFLKTTMVISLFVFSFIMYFQNRLLFQMCIDKMYKETFKPLNENQKIKNQILDMQGNSGAISGLNTAIDNEKMGPLMKGFFSAARAGVATEIDTNAGQVYNSVNTLTSKDEVSPVLVAKFATDSIDVDSNPKFWSKWANQINQATLAQTPTIASQPVIGPSRSNNNCEQPNTCPVSGDTPFCTSTGWACPRMWTPNVQNYGHTDSSQIDPKVLTYTN